MIAGDIILFAIVLLLAGLFSGFETGFVSANPIRIHYLAEEEHNFSARRLLRHIQEPNAMISLLLVGTNISIVVGTMAMKRVGEHFIPEYADLGAALVVTPLILIFSEIIPKSVFRAHPTRLTLLFVPFIDFFSMLLFPVVWPITMITRKFLRTAEGESHTLSALMETRDDVRALIDESLDQGAIEPQEQQMIHSVINLQTTQAKEIMVPRVDIQALPIDACREDLLALFVQSGRTRIPVYRESIDHIIGIINAYDVLRDKHPDNPDIGRFIRDVLHVPDTMKVDELFRLMKRRKRHIAIVIDEYGGTDGLLSMEDILEEIFGEIQDEHDAEEQAVRKAGENVYIIDARTSLEDVCELTGLELEDDEVDTIGGWVLHIAGKIPEKGEVILQSPYRVTILDGTQTQVSRIKLEVLPHGEKEDKDVHKK